MADAYNLFPIAGATLLFYAASWICARRKFAIDVLVHRRIWNAVLAISFFVTGATAIIFLLQHYYRLAVPKGFDATFWHVEFGIVMLIIAFFHAAWNIPYFLQYLPRAKKAEEKKEGAPGSQVS